MEVLRLIGWVYLSLGGFTLLLCFVAAFLGDGVTLRVGDRQLEGWRYGFVLVFLLILACLLWPMVWYAAQKED